MPVLSLALLCLTPRAPATHYLVHRFADCPQAAAYSAAHPALGRFAYRVDATLSHGNIWSAGAERFEARVGARLFLSSAWIELPRWSWSGMTTEQRNAYNAFVASLRDHELGHATIAQSAIRGPVGLTVLARSRTQAEHALHTALQQLLQTTSEELLRKERLYDRVTEHGKKQSEGPLYGFPGGNDVEFSCP